MFLFIFLCTTTQISKENRNLYHASPYDPLNKSEVKQKGYLETHNPHDPTTGGFGDVSIMTLNLYTVASTDESDEIMTNAILKLLDEHHMTFLLLQAVSEKILNSLARFFEANLHYHLVLTEKFEFDAIYGVKLYFPILYDSTIVEKVKTGYFETDEKRPRMYANYIEAKDKRVNDDFTYTVINIDLFSTFKNTVRAEFFNIVIDILDSNVGTKSVFLCGSMNVITSDIKRMFDISFRNVIDVDLNNKNLGKTTMRNPGLENGHQKDFILLRDANNRFVTNYARILTEFDKGDRYPVYAIFTFKEANSKPNIVHLSDLMREKSKNSKKNSNKNEEKKKDEEKKAKEKKEKDEKEEKKKKEKAGQMKKKEEEEKQMKEKEEKQKEKQKKEEEEKQKKEIKEREQKNGQNIQK